MPKYIAAQLMPPNTSSRLTENLPDEDVPMFMFLIIIITVLIVVFNTLQTWDNAAKTLPVNIDDSCFSTAVNIHRVERYQQSLSPIRRSRSNDSMV
uniref:Uncharacterized protein n=1 Tax=viral metagenome TaxID=1070528 RepID=A0A6C0EP06_9ZZZZ